MKIGFKSLILILFVVALAVVPLLLMPEAEFLGADGLAEEAIAELNPDYNPWFSSVWEPPSGEVESLLFALQAALGSGFVFYYFGYRNGRKSKDNEGIKP